MKDDFDFYIDDNDDNDSIDDFIKSFEKKTKEYNDEVDRRRTQKYKLIFIEKEKEGKKDEKNSEIDRPH